MNDPDALLEFARQALARADYGAALAHARSVLAADPARDEALVLAANASIRLDDLESAVAALEALVARHPEREPLRRQASIALNNLGSRLIQRGETKAATERLARALALWPDNANAWFNRARIAIEARQFGFARDFLRRAATLKPDDKQFALELAEAEIACGEVEALPRVRSALAALHAGGAVDASRLAAALTDAGEPDAAVSELTRLTDPSRFDAVFTGARRLLDNGCHAAARATFAHGAALGRRGERSPSLTAVIGEQLALPDLYPSRAALDQARSAYIDGLAALHAECTEARLRRLEPRLEQLQWSNFMLAYQGGDDRASAQAYGTFLQRALGAFAPRLLERPPGSNAAAPRVGLLSSAFRYSTAGSYFASWVEALTRAGIDTTVFQLGPFFDDYTTKIGASANHLVKLGGDLASSVEAVRAARLDLLIYPDPQVDGRLVLLSAMRLAPRQLAAWGHPSTTGLGTIDGFLTCAAMEPDDAAAHYSEPLLPLPDLGTAYLSPNPPARRSRAELGLPESRRLYYVPQSHYKVHPDSDAVFAAIAARDPEATLVFYRANRPGATRMLQTRLAQALRAEGADPDRQLHFLPLTTRSRFLEYTAACDLMVDCLHWSGGNTTLDALHCGLPVVTCAGRFMRGRQSYAMLRMLGVDADLVAPDPVAMAERAVALGRDPERLEQLRQAIAARLPDLLDGKRALAALVETVRAQLAATP